MCSIYLHADPHQYESHTRSIRIDKVVTTIRLENLFWTTLANIAAEESKTVNQFITTLFSELYSSPNDTAFNFTSFLRVCCLRYLLRHGANDSIQTSTGAQSLSRVA